MILYCLMALAVLLGVLAAAGSVRAASIKQAPGSDSRFITIDETRLHVVELGASAGSNKPALVLIHGASSNIEDMRLSLGTRLSARYRVIMIDRPGHGWSERRAGDNQSSPRRQAELIDGVLRELKVPRAIIVAHSFGGAVATALALNQPQRVAGLVLLGPVTHPWPGGIAWYYNVARQPVLGEIFAYTLAWPIGSLAIDAGVRSVFAPQPVPEHYTERAAIRLVLRPENFLANARDVAGLLDFVTQQAPRYPQIKMPVAILTGTDDDIVSPVIHSKAFARAVPQTKLTLLPNVGHMPHYAAPEKVEAAIDAIAAQTRSDKASAGAN